MSLKKEDYQSMRTRYNTRVVLLSICTKMLVAGDDGHGRGRVNAIGCMRFTIFFLQRETGSLYFLLMMSIDVVYCIALFTHTNP